MKTNVRKMVLLAIMVSQAIVLSIIESWIPVSALVPGIPGIKLGLANIVTLIALIFFGTGEALVVVAVRSFLTSIFGGGPTVLLFSMTGGILSALVMALLFKRLSRVFGMVGISVAGAVTHNAGQLIVAALLLRDWAVFGYLPVLLGSGVVMGCFVGLCSGFLSTALKKTGVMSQGMK